MKNVTLIVHIQAEIPDDVNPQYLHLGNDYPSFIIQKCGCITLGDAKVTSYETMEVIEHGNK